MDARKLTVEGAVEFTPPIFHDDRGLATIPFQEPAFVQATGRPLFHVAQSIHSSSQQDVLRGVHLTRTPPGTAKYVYCAQGEALDIVVDLRIGSPTFGAVDTVLMDQRDFHAVYLPIGVGHAFVALCDDTVMSYLLSRCYVAKDELAISARDPRLGLPLPQGIEPILSERDRAAPTFAEAWAQGVLPEFTRCQQIEQELSCTSS